MFDLKNRFLEPQEEEIGIEAEVEQEASTSGASRIVQEEESVEIPSHVDQIQSSESTVCPVETEDTPFEPLPPIMATC